MQVQDNINNIAESEEDYVEILQQYPEKATDNIQYILRGQKILKLPVSKIDNNYIPLHINTKSY